VKLIQFLHQSIRVHRLCVLCVVRAFVRCALVCGVCVLLRPPPPTLFPRPRSGPGRLPEHLSPAELAEELAREQARLKSKEDEAWQAARQQSLVAFYDGCHKVRLGLKKLRASIWRCRVL